MHATETSIPGVLILEPTRHVDERGSFTELFNLDTLESMGVDDHFVQENLAVSITRGTIRGLHAQAPPEPQAKLVRVARGAILDVAVDLRVGSPTHGQHVAVELDADTGRQLYVPTGLLHGYCTLTDDTEVAYWVAGRWRPELEFGVRWDDPALGIEWPVDSADVVLSERDQMLPHLAEVESPFIGSDVLAGGGR
jgi:dTDP-4-dehydrorhamnose 3,5-epimerase